MKKKKKHPNFKKRKKKRKKKKSPETLCSSKTTRFSEKSVTVYLKLSVEYKFARLNNFSNVLSLLAK